MIKRYLRVDPGKEPKAGKAGTSKLKKTPFLPHPKSKGQEVVMAATGKQTNKQKPLQHPRRSLMHVFAAFCRIVYNVTMSCVPMKFSIISSLDN